MVVVAGGVCSHRSVLVRVATAHHLRLVVDQLGPYRALHEFPDKLLPAASRFMLDASLQARCSTHLCKPGTAAASRFLLDASLQATYCRQPRASCSTHLCKPGTGAGVTTNSGPQDKYPTQSLYPLSLYPLFPFRCIPPLTLSPYPYNG